jgi:hypothetical protein
MRRINRMIFGTLASAALLTGVAGAALTAVSTAVPTSTTAATAIEYGARHQVTVSNPTAVEYAGPGVTISNPTAVEY